LLSYNYTAIMAKQIDIRKVKTAGSEHYETVAESMPMTYTCHRTLESVSASFFGPLVIR
jgi:hypothetical protein